MTEEIKNEVRINIFNKGASTIGSHLSLSFSMIGMSIIITDSIANYTMPPLQRVGIIVGSAIVVGSVYSILSSFINNAPESIVNKIGMISNTAKTINIHNMNEILS